MQYIIKAVSPDVKDINGKYGPAKVYKLRLIDYTDVVDLMVAADKPAPQPGEQLDGTIERNDYGHYFKKDKKQFTPRSAGKANFSPYSMYAAYAKDLVVAYMNAVDWDLSKFNEDTFHTVIDATSDAAKRLRESENDKPTEKSEITTEDVKDSWADDIPEGF